MPNNDPGSVTTQIEAMRKGDQDAARELWERYFERLVRLARARFPAFRKAGSVDDEEDAALSAFGKICVGLPDGRFPELANRDDLWRMLVLVTRRVAINHGEARDAVKRGGGRVVSAAELVSEDGVGDHFATDPTPEFVDSLDVLYERLKRELAKDDPDGKLKLTTIAELKLAGKTEKEIADQLGWSRRTISTRLGLIREILGWIR